MRSEAAARTNADPLAAARGLAPQVRALATEAEARRTTPPDLVEALRDAGLFAMGIPASLGGPETSVATMLGAIEEIADADGSTGWCVAIAATSGILGAYLEPATAGELFGPRTIAGGVFAPKGSVEVVEGGYRATGRWAFASGCQHCDVLMGGCIVDGVPAMLAFTRDQVEIIDTWHVSGLRGTGSHDMAVSDVVVPASRCVSLISDRPREPGPLYRFPVFGLLALGIAAVGLGIARRATSELVELAEGKVPTLGRRTLAKRSAVQVDVAKAEALRLSARAFLFAAVEDAWDTGELTVDHRARLRLAATNAARSCAQAVDLCYEAGGGTSIYEDGALQRCFRDIHAVTQHMMVAPASYEIIGRTVLGLPTDTSML